jgi:hypothetical protein
MPRQAMIRPEFFRDEVLAEVEPLGRLLYMALWCWTDGQGRIEDEPSVLARVMLAGRACDADDLLEQLARRGFVRRFAAPGQRFVEIVGFRGGDRGRDRPRLMEWRGERAPASPAARRARRRARRQRIAERDGWICGICGAPIARAQLHIDHIVPVCRGGTSDASNLQAAHARCNLAKGGRA